MKKVSITGALCLTLAFLLISAGVGQAQSGNISGPYTHKNLEIFLVHDNSAVDTRRKYMPLKEAMDKEIVIVHETGSVQKLSIENTSADIHIFIHSGDIVKGGKQDRVIRFDIVLNPKSGKIPLDSFCVESGRWRKRGGEKLSEFSSSKQMVSSKKLKIAAKYRQNQGAVWSSVAEQQDRLNDSLRKITGKNNLNVRSSNSASSLQLTLENKDLGKTVEEYRKVFDQVVARQKNVVGFAFAINGEINSADVYRDPALFQSLWPKLLKSAIVEAIGEYDKKKHLAPLPPAAVKTMFEESEKARASSRDISKKTKLNTREDKNYLLFETQDADADASEWIHRNYIKKDPNTAPAPRQVPQQQQQIQINQSNQENDIQQLQQQEIQLRQKK